MTNTPPTRDTHEFLYTVLLECLNKTSVKTLADYLARTFAGIVGGEEAAIFLRRGNVYTIQGSYSVRKAKVDASQVGYKSPFVRRLKQIGKTVISKYQDDFSVDEFKVLFMKHTLSRFEIDHAIILGGKKFIGFVVLGKSQGKLSRETSALLEHLAHQAYASIDYHGVRDALIAAASELKDVREMRNHLMREFPYGVIFIEYGTEKITMINSAARLALRLDKVAVVGKLVGDLLDAYQEGAFADFLRVYKEVKSLRRTFRAGLFDRYAFRTAQVACEISSVFIGGGGRTRGDFITLKPLTAPAIVWNS